MSDDAKETTPDDPSESPQEAAPSTGEAPAASGEAATTPEPPAAEVPPKPAPAAEQPKAEEKPAERRSGDKAVSEDVFKELDPSAGEAPKIVKAKGSKNVHSGIVHVLATFNNTIVTVTDLNGNVLGWSSSGKVGFRGSRKSTAYAAQLVSQDACRQAMGHGLREAEVRVKGPGSGRESAVRAVQAIGIDITSIRDVTPVPHNGCRPPKPRRV